MARDFLFKANGKTVAAYCECKSDRYGFTHICHLIIEGENMCEGRARWINRTWETFTYQTALRNAIERGAACLFDNALYCWQNNNGVSRMTRKQKALFAAWYVSADNPYYDRLQTFAHCAHWIACRGTYIGSKKPRYSFKKYVYCPSAYLEFVRGC